MPIGGIGDRRIGSAALAVMWLTFFSMTFSCAGALYFATHVWIGLGDTSSGGQ